MVSCFITRQLKLSKVKYLGYDGAGRGQSWEQNPVLTSSPNCSRMYNADTISGENKLCPLNGCAWGHAPLGSLFISVH